MHPATWHGWSPGTVPQAKAAWQTPVRAGVGQENQSLPIRAAETRSGAALQVSSLPVQCPWWGVGHETPLQPCTMTRPGLALLSSGTQGAVPGALPAVGQPGTGPGAPSRCCSGLLNPGGHGTGLCIHPTGHWTTLSAQGLTGWLRAAHPAYNRPATKLVKLPTTSEQSLGEAVEQEGQESSDLLCSGSWKALGQLQPNLCGVQRCPCGCTFTDSVHVLVARRRAKINACPLHAAAQAS